MNSTAYYHERNKQRPPRLSASQWQRLATNTTTIATTGAMHSPEVNKQSQLTCKQSDQPCTIHRHARHGREAIFFY